MKNMKKNDKMLLIVFISVVALVACIGISYAYYTAVIDRGEESASVVSKAGNLEITYIDGNKQIIGANIFPGWSDSKTFTVKNTGDTDSAYSIMVTNIVNNFSVTDSISLALSSTDGGKSLSKKPLPGNDAILINNVNIKRGKSHTYTLTTYYNNLDVDQSEDRGKSFSYTIEIGRSAGKVTEPEGWSTAEEGTALAKLRATFGDPTSPLTTPGKQASGYTTGLGWSDILMNVTGAQMDGHWTYGTGYKRNSDGTFNLTGVVKSDYFLNPDMVGTYIMYSTAAENNNNYNNSTNNLSIIYYIQSVSEDEITKVYLVPYASPIDIDEKVMASTKDDYGTSYYFRGDVDKTFVKFANMCWRIVRITGDGSIKMILVNGGSADCASVNPYMDDVNYDPISTNFNEKSLVNSGIGFMYGSYNASNYNEAHANTHDSNSLVGLKKWYDDYLREVSDTYLADVIWCNDKSLYSGIGYGANKSTYGGASRLENPSLVCPNAGSDGKLSKFTASDTTYGNGKLRGTNGIGDSEYKIGLLTVDEAIFAGNAFGKYSFNTLTNYITGNSKVGIFRTMTPYGYDGSNAYMYSFSFQGITKTGIDTVMNYIPVIALKGNTPFTGTGTRTDPFVVNVS